MTRDFKMPKYKNTKEQDFNIDLDAIWFDFNVFPGKIDQFEIETWMKYECRLHKNISVYFYSVNRVFFIILV